MAAGIALRRSTMPENKNVQFRADDLLISPQNNRAEYKGNPVDLTHHEAKMLSCVHAAYPRAVPIAELSASVWAGEVVGDLSGVRWSLNRKLLPLGLEIREDANWNCCLGLASEPAGWRVEVGAGLKEVRKKVRSARRGSKIVALGEWDDAVPVVTRAKKSIVILDTFFSEFPDFEKWLRNAIKYGAASLEVSFYIASKMKPFGAQRIKEMEAASDDDEYKARLWKPTDPSVLYQDKHNSKFNDTVSGIRDYLKPLRERVHLIIYEYPIMPAVRIMIVDGVHIFFGWFPLKTHNPGFVCCYLCNEGLAGAELKLAEALCDQLNIIKDVSEEVREDLP